MTKHAFADAKVMTAIKTPYNQDGSIDFKAYAQLLTRQQEAGIEGIIVAGTTGEGHLLSGEEKLELIKATKQQVGDSMLVVGNTGSNNTSAALNLTQAGFDAGMDAALQINPFYGKTSDAGVYAHLRTLLDVGPAIIYNVPGRTGQDITPEMLGNLLTHPNFVGMKECQGTERIRFYREQGVLAWSGNDDECHDSRHQADATGVISVASNLLPHTMHALMTEQNADLNHSLQPLFTWLFEEPNPIAVNTALMMAHQAQPVFRLPYVALNQAQRQQGVSLLTALQGKEPLLSKLDALTDTDFTLTA